MQLIEIILDAQTTPKHTRPVDTPIAKTKIHFIASYFLAFCKRN